MRRNTFLQGAIILALGGLISKVLGAVYRIILPMLWGPDMEYGMGLLSYSLNIYGVALNLSSLGIPLAIAKLVSERTARGETASALRLFRVSSRVLAGLGFIFTAVMVAVAFVFSRFYDPNALYPMLAVAPAILVVSVMSAYRGLFQGMQVMTPFAASQVIEQLMRIATIFILGVALLPRGIEFAAAGASFGAVSGALAGLAYLLVYFRRIKEEVYAPGGGGNEGGQPPEPALKVAAEVLRLAIPMSLAALALALMSLTDTLLVPLRLQHIGLSKEHATASLGILGQLAASFLNLPLVITTALTLSVVPAVTEAFTSGGTKRIRHIVSSGLRAALLLTMPAAAGLGLLAREIPDVLWSAPQVGEPLRILAVTVVFIGVQQVTSGALQGLDLPLLPVRNLLAGVVVKVVLTWYLTGIPHLGIKGAAYASVAGLLTAMTLNLFSVTARLGSPPISAGGAARPLLASAIMGGAVELVKTTMPMGASGLALAIAVGAAVYAGALFAVGGVTGDDLDMIPGLGPRLRRWAEARGWIR